MTAEEFVKGFYLERQTIIDSLFSNENKTEVSELIRSLPLDEKGKERLRQILSSTLRDAFYTILLGLDGEASIGSKQTLYNLFDENNNELSGGDIEVAAYEYFHNNKFQIDKAEADFIAKLTFLTMEQGGRQKPVFSGYRPQVKFEFSEMQTSGQCSFIDRNSVYPGDTVEAEIRIIAVEHFSGKLNDNLKFELREGLTIIGTGEIKHVVNKELKQTNR